uniref:Uncharacterized protein n=1 Tax=Hyaloperonospora arabidopsidis (strain Emoy2) TaxID=559515 RepID=M4BG63_HYAAE
METKMSTRPPSPTPSSALITPRESPQGEQATPSLKGSISDSPSTANDGHEGKRRLDKARRRASHGRLLTRDPNKKPRAASAQRTASRRRKRQECAEGLKCVYDSDNPPRLRPISLMPSVFFIQEGHLHHGLLRHVRKQETKLPASLSTRHSL